MRSAESISEVLSICTKEFEALDEFDEDEYGEDEYGDDDAFMGLEDASYTSSKKKKEPEPEVDTSMFRIPSGYEPSCVQAIIGEYKNILKMPKEERQFDAAPINNDISQWEVKLYGFPSDEPLSKDMRSYGIDHITLNVLFPPNYPFYPPFLRVIRPRFAFRTGHVTVGGAICTHVLTNEGWVATYRLPQILVDIRAMMISGNGRLDTSNRSDYTESEALDALRRLLATHSWKHWKA